MSLALYGVVAVALYALLLVKQDLVNEYVAKGGLYAFLPIVVLLGLGVGRTAREDRFLQENLEGYADYAARVRVRLIPGLW